MARRRQRFIDRRVTVGLSQEQLADAVTVERTTVGRWETAESSPQPAQRPRLAEALNVTVEQLQELLLDIVDLPNDDDGASGADVWHPSKDALESPGHPEAPATTAPATTLSSAEPSAEPGEERLVLDRRVVLCGAAATLGVHEAEVLRRELTAEVEHAAMADASLDDWEHTVYQYGLSSGYRSAESLLVDLTADFAELRHLLGRRRAILVPNRLTRVMAQMAGLMTIPLNKLGQAVAARNWARTAKLIASEAGDNKLHAWVLGQQAYAHYYSGSLIEAVYVASHAQRMAQQAPCAGVAHAAALEARAHALSGRVEEAYAAIGRAEQALSGMNAQELAPSAFDYDQARFHFHTGNAYTHLGKTAAAFDAQERALELYPNNSYFDRALVMLDRADCFVHDNDIPTATEWAVWALQGIGTEQRNPLIDNRANQVFRRIPRSAAGLPVVQELRELLRG